jgi:hypothetical protein
MTELLNNIYLAFNEISTDMSCKSDFFELPTYWHIDGIPFLINKTKNGISIESHNGFPIKLKLTNDTNKNNITKSINITFYNK